MKNIQKKLAISTFSTLASIGFFSAPVKAVSVVFDQRNDNFGPNITYYAQFYSPIGQSFVPRFKSLNVVELFTEDFGFNLGASLLTNIRSNTIDGPIIGSSSLVTLPKNFAGITRFNFPSVVSLNPNQKYVIEVRVALGDPWGIGTIGGEDFYPKGGAILRGEPAPVDLWFREGIEREGIEVPESSTLLSSGLALGFGIFLKSQLKSKKR